MLDPYLKLLQLVNDFVLDENTNIFLHEREGERKPVQSCKLDGRFFFIYLFILRSDQNQQ